MSEEARISQLKNCQKQRNLKIENQLLKAQNKQQQMEIELLTKLD